MARTFLIFAVPFVLLAGLAGAFFLFSTPPVQVRDWSGITGDAVRGQYVSRLAGCVACHTLPEGAGPLLTGGAPIITPFGAFGVPNITPDRASGIGSWTRDDFAAALLNGTSPDGSSYYPVFPYASYARMSTQDVADLWAYLQTVPPVQTPARAHDLAWPFSQRVLMRAWKNLFFSSAEFQPNPQRSQAWNRGAYIVSGPGHCGECHSPRGWLGNINEARALQGGEGPGGKTVPAITAQALLDQGWSRGDLAFALFLSITPDGDSLGGAMGEVIREGTRHLTPEDRSAIEAYLLGLPEAAD